ncbi:MAG: translation elongation factor-like protein [Myxococcota bacterium]|nr:translation elongation factor-like protein [Myxococcota bacterium]
MSWLSRLFGAGAKSESEADLGKPIGRVQDYFAKVGVVAVRLEKPLAVGDKLRVKGHTTDFTQPVKSIQIEHESVDRASRGAAVGIKVKKKCRRGDSLYKLSS